MGVTGGVFLALAQNPWEHDELSAGKNARNAQTVAVSDAPAAKAPLDPRAFGVEPGALRDAVASGPVLRMDAIGPAPVMDAVPKANGVVIGAPAAATAAAAAKTDKAAAAGKVSAMGKNGAKDKKGSKTKGEVADGPGGPSAKHKGGKGDGQEGGGKSRGGSAGRAGKNGASGSASGRAGSKASLRTNGGSSKNRFRVGDAAGDSPAAGRKGKSRSGGALSRLGRGADSADGSGAGGRKGRGGKRGHGGDSSGSDDPFASGNSKVKIGKEHGGSSGGKGGGHKKSGARGGKGGGGSKGGDGDDEDAPKGKGGGKSAKSGGGHKGGGGHGPKGGGKDKPAKDPNKGKGAARPILSSELDGEKTPKPPAKVAAPPDFGGLDKNIPAKDDRGASIKPEPAGYQDIEGVKTPKLPPSGTDKFDWKTIGDTPYYCKGSVCGRWSDAHWVWMQNKDGKWWIQSYSPRPDGSVGTDSPAYEQHQGHWWWQDDKSGSWYVVHDGQPWSHRYLSQFKQDGLVNPQTGTTMVHTPDGNVLVVTPGKGADVYDGKTGAFKEHRDQDQLPPVDQKPPKDPFPVE